MRCARLEPNVISYIRGCTNQESYSTAAWRPAARGLASRGQAASGEAASGQRPAASSQRPAAAASGQAARRSFRLEPDEISYSSAISACEKGRQ